MQNTDGSFWATDERLFAGLKGAGEITDWFGFVPDFHDAILDQLILNNKSAVLTIRAHRMTNEVDPNGFFVLDKHAVVTLSLAAVSGFSLTGDVASIISELGIRRVGANPPRIENCAGPGEGDFELSIESSYGLEGSIYARQVSFAFQPA